MDNLSIFFSVVMVLAMIVLIAPGTIARSRGKTMRNIALWLAIFTALALVYRSFGPVSEHQLFAGPVVVMHRGADESKDDAVSPAKSDTDKPDGSQGFTPPSE